MIKLKNILRWVAFIPAAILAGWIAWIAILYGNKFTMSLMGIDSHSITGHLGIAITSGFAMGATFIYAGAHAAPSINRVALYALSIAIGAITITTAYMAILDKNYWALVEVSATVLGSYIAYITIAEELVSKDLLTKGEAP